MPKIMKIGRQQTVIAKISSLTSFWPTLKVLFNVFQKIQTKFTVGGPNLTWSNSRNIG